MAKVFLESTDSSYTVSNNGVKVFGATGTQAITLDSGVTGVTVNSLVDQVNLGKLGDYKISQEGTNLVVENTSDAVVTTIGTNELASKLHFTDTGDTALNISPYNSTSTMQIALPNLVSGSTPAAASTLKALDTAFGIVLDTTATTAISGAAADVKALVDSANAQSVGIILKDDVAVTVSDAAYDSSSNDVTIAATTLSSIGAKTTGDVTVTNAVKIAGTAAEVETALVDAANSGASLVKAETALVTISDAADATALKAADLVAIDAKTTGTVTITNAVALTGSAADLNTVLVTNATTTVDAGSEAVAISDDKDSAILAATIKAIDDATTGTLSITNSIEIDGTAGSNTTADTIDVSGITFTSKAVTIDGKDGADIITGGTEVDTLKGGDDNDTFIFDATSSATVLVNPESESNDNDGVSTAKDSIVDFASGDLIQITGELADGFNVSTDVLVGTGEGTDDNADTGDTAKDYKATTYLVARDGDVTDGFDTGIDVTSNGTDAAFANNAKAQAATVFNVTLAADTSSKGVTLGAGADIVVAGATASKVTLGAGDDTFTGGAGVDTIVFADTADNNGKDTINAFTFGEGKDVMDFDAILTADAAFYEVANAGTAIADDGVAEDSTGEIALANLDKKVVLVTASDISKVTVDEDNLFGSGDAFAAEGTTAYNMVLLVGETSGTDGVKAYYVTDGTAADDMTITLVGTLAGVSLADVHADNLA